MKNRNRVNSLPGRKNTAGSQPFDPSPLRTSVCIFVYFPQLSQGCVLTIYSFVEDFSIPVLWIITLFGVVTTESVSMFHSMLLVLQSGAFLFSFGGCLLDTSLVSAMLEGLCRLIVPLVWSKRLTIPLTLLSFRGPLATLLVLSENVPLIDALEGFAGDILPIRCFAGLRNGGCSTPLGI
jgi:hypothetical protein